MEMPPLSSRIAPHGTPGPPPPSTTPGGAALNVSDATIHGVWYGFSVGTVEDYNTLRDAADQGSDAALLYIGFLNATRQRTPLTSRSAGIQELLSDWGRFSKPHEERRARLHEKHGIKTTRSKGKKPQSHPTDPSSSSGAQGPNNDAVRETSPVYMDTDVAAASVPRAVSEPMPDIPNEFTTGPSSTGADTNVAPLIDTPMGQADDPRLSAFGRHLATLDPGEWPPGIHANIDGHRVAISAELLGTVQTPWADDVHACEVFDSLAPALVEGDPSSIARREAFRHTGVRLWAVLDYVMILYGRIGAPMGDRPVEPFPFEFEDYNMVHVAAWFHDHGIELESETASNLHQYAVSAYPFLPGALPTGPPTSEQMNAGSAGQRMDIAVSRFQYPPLHFTQPERDWVTATEEFFARGRAGLGFRPAAAFPDPPALVSRAVRPTSGPYSLARVQSSAPRSAPTPEPGPVLGNSSRRTPSDDGTVPDYTMSDDETSSRM